MRTDLGPKKMESLRTLHRMCTVHPIWNNSSCSYYYQIMWS
jgi:hypothetical protein